MSLRTALPVAALALSACQVAPPPLPARGETSGAFTLAIHQPAGGPAPDAPPGTAAPTSPAPGGPADARPGPDEPSPPPASPTPAASAAASPAGGSGGSGGSRGDPAAPLAIRDEFGRPVVGATVRLANGRTLTSDADGLVRYPGAFPQGRAEVAHPEFVPSLALDLADAEALHLRHGGGSSGSFDERTIAVPGQVTWPIADLRNTAASFQGDRATFSLNGAVSLADGAFALDVVTAAPGDPVGSLLLAGSDGTGTLLYGVSGGFAPFTDPAPGAIALVRADQPVAFSIAAAPADLPDVESRVELVRPNVPLVVLERRAVPSGTWMVPATGALPGTLRVALAARSADGRRDSLASLIPTAGTAAASLLAPPTATLDAATRTVSWSRVAGASGYLIELAADGQAGTAWEAWTTAGASLAVPEALWPEAGEVVVRAIAAPGFTSRSIASLPEGPRRLRLEPWTASDTYRVATTRLRF